MQGYTAIAICAVALWGGVAAAPQDGGSPWNHPRLQHMSTLHGGLEPPNSGNQQTASLVVDLDNDGLNDFVIAERTQAPALVWYRRGPTGWERRVIEDGPLRIEAGAAAHDITGNGYPDIVCGGDAGSNELWWWENPGPPHAGERWTRRAIKASGANKHHDVIFGDFTGSGRTQLAFWSQGDQALYVADVPPDPRAHAGEWPRRAIYRYHADSEMAPRGEYPSWRRTHEHEGLDAADINGDGVLDIVGGGRWFEHVGEGRFAEHLIDASYTFVRTAAGQLIDGGRPEVVFVAGDGFGPLMLYEWQGGTWVSRLLMPRVQDGHSLQVIDFDGDGHLDVFVAEMQLGKNPSPTTWLLRGTGTGAFESQPLLRGYGMHEARVADLNGNGRLDILAKPYTWQAPRLDIWINTGVTFAGPAGEWR
jgi:hypothetical protein